jgi:DNA polymerase zeta
MGRLAYDISLQIEGPTQSNIYGLQNSPFEHSDTSRIKIDMTVFSLELFGEQLGSESFAEPFRFNYSSAPSRGNSVPDPGVDEIVSICYSFQDSRHDGVGSHQIRPGKIVVENDRLHPRRLRNFELDVVPTELELINRVIDIVVDLDPDVVVGWEIQAASWGYLNARGLQYGSSAN